MKYGENQNPSGLFDTIKQFFTNPSSIIGVRSLDPSMLIPGSSSQVLTVDPKNGVASFATKNARVGTFTVPAATGNFSVKGLGFKPSLVQFTNSWATPLSEVLGGQGAMDAAGNSWVTSFEENTTPSRYTGGGTGACIYLAGGTGTTIYEATPVSMDADGFTVNFIAANASGAVYWIAT